MNNTKLGNNVFGSLQPQQEKKKPNKKQKDKIKKTHRKVIIIRSTCAPSCMGSRVSTSLDFRIV